MTESQHTACRTWLSAALGARTPVGLAWTALLAFLRVATRAGVFTRPLTTAEAFDLLDLWLAAPAATVVAPAERHASLLRDLLVRVGTGGNLTSDAHLAALALEHGATVVSCDHDFLRFPGVRLLDPTAP
ncbi:MAG: TA system VapC family ribonuclease toxin [Myxococcota bacterium]